MTKTDYINYWIITAKDDIETSLQLLDSGKYVWSLFIAHLSLEKLFKAFWVRDNEINFPPKTHDLNRIVKETKLNFSDEEKEFLAEVTSFNLEVRYPDYKRRFNEKGTKEFASNYLSRIKELFECTLEKK